MKEIEIASAAKMNNNDRHRIDSGGAMEHEDVGTMENTNSGSSNENKTCNE